MVRRHHPLEGRLLELTQGGPQQVVVRLPDGTTTRIPRGWTDLDGPPDDPGADLVCALPGLVKLTELIEALLGRREGPP